MPEPSTPPCIGLLSPGEMGSSVGARLSQRGATVLTCLAGRSDRSRQRAAAAGMQDVPDLETLVTRSDVLLSILVPAEAVAVAGRVADALRAIGAQLLYADCNAVSPGTARVIGEVIVQAGSRFADAGIIGSPLPSPSNQLFASGPAADEFAQLTALGLNITVVGPEIGSASALKMCYAALTKGLQALGTELLVAARALGLEDILRQQQQGSLAPVRAQLEGGLPGMPAKAHRWVGEMEEIARTFGDVGLPETLFQGAADVFRFVSSTPLGSQDLPREGRPRDWTGVVTSLAGELPGGRANEKAGVPSEPAAARTPGA